MITNNSAFFVVCKVINQRRQAATHEEADAWRRRHAVIHWAAWCIKKSKRARVAAVDSRLGGLEGKLPSSRFQGPIGGHHKLRVEAVRKRTVPRRQVHNKVG
jgi:GTP-sensing pleiotropic transcriptional regulator CodY